MLCCVVLFQWQIPQMPLPLLCSVQLHIKKLTRKANTVIKENILLPLLSVFVFTSSNVNITLLRSQAQWHIQCNSGWNVTPFVFNLHYETLTMFVRGSGSVRLTRSQMWLGASPAQFTGQPRRWPIKSMSLNEIWNKGRVKSNLCTSVKLYHRHSHLIQEDLSFHYVASVQWLNSLGDPNNHYHTRTSFWLGGGSMQSFL